MEPGASTLVLHDRRLARVPDLAMSIEGHAGVAGEKVRVDAGRQAPVQQRGSGRSRSASPPDRWPDALDVGRRAAAKRVLHREPDRRAGRRPRADRTPPAAGRARPGPGRTRTRPRPASSAGAGVGPGEVSVPRGPQFSTRPTRDTAGVRTTGWRRKLDAFSSISRVVAARAHTRDGELHWHVPCSALPLRRSRIADARRAERMNRGTPGAEGDSADVDDAQPRALARTSARARTEKRMKTRSIARRTRGAAPAPGRLLPAALGGAGSAARRPRLPWKRCRPSPARATSGSPDPTRGSRQPGRTSGCRGTGPSRHRASSGYRVTGRRSRTARSGSMGSGVTTDGRGARSMPDGRCDGPRRPEGRRARRAP